MEFNININQAALRKWIARGQLDAADGMIVAFIRGLSPDDPTVQQYMEDGYFRLSRAWILQEIPILGFKAERLSDRLANLQECGILKLKHVVDARKQHLLFGRLTNDYFAQEKKARDEVLPTGGLNTTGGLSTARYTENNPAVFNPPDHKKDDHKRDDAPLLSGEGAAPKEKEAPTPERTVEESIRSLPWNLSKPKEEERVESN